MLSKIGVGFCEPDASVTVQQDGVEPLSEISMGGGIWLERKQCSRVVFFAQAALCAGVVAATLLQFVGALQVREYGNRLAAMEVRESDVVIVREGEDTDVEEKEYGYRESEFERYRVDSRMTSESSLRGVR